jgi:uncharacterized protein (DUF433 family)
MIDRTLLERIESDSRILCGKPVIRGTRISVELILEKLSYGDDFETICREFDIEQNDVKAALAYASANVQETESCRNW